MEPDTSKDIAELSRAVLTARLHGVPALTDLGVAGRAALAGVATPISFATGQPVISQGEPASSFYILLNGRVKMERALPNGRSLVLSLFGPGELFGSVAALGSEPADSSMVAIERSLCLQVRREDLLRLLEDRPELVRQLLPLLTRRLAECKNCLVELTSYRVEVRFAKLFLKLADSVGQPQDDGELVPIPLSRQELADMTGTAIETCIRVMSRWGKEGVVETVREGFVVRDRATLRQRARG